MQYVQCTPTSKNWDDSVEGTCWPHEIYVDFAIFAGGKLTHDPEDVRRKLIYASAYSSALDLYYAVFPLPILWKVIQDNRKRISLCCSMSLGVL